MLLLLRLLPQMLTGKMQYAIGIAHMKPVGRVNPRWNEEESMAMVQQELGCRPEKVPLRLTKPCRADDAAKKSYNAS